MSKSLGNFVTTRDAARFPRCRAGRRAAALFPAARPLPQRVRAIRANRSTTPATRCAASTRRCARCRPAGAGIDWSDPHAARFRDAMNDDFDTPGRLRGAARAARRGQPHALGAAVRPDAGPRRNDRAAAGRSGQAIPPGRGAIATSRPLIVERDAARKARDFARGRPDPQGPGGRRHRPRGQAGRADGVAAQVKGPVARAFARRAASARTSGRAR